MSQMQSYVWDESETDFFCVVTTQTLRCILICAKRWAPEENTGDSVGFISLKTTQEDGARTERKI